MVVLLLLLFVIVVCDCCCDDDDDDDDDDATHSPTLVPPIIHYCLTPPSGFPFDACQASQRFTQKRQVIQLCILRGTVTRCGWAIS